MSLYVGRNTYGHRVEETPDERRYRFPFCNRYHTTPVEIINTCLETEDNPQLYRMTDAIAQKGIPFTPDEQTLFTPPALWLTAPSSPHPGMYVQLTITGILNTDKQPRSIRRIYAEYIDPVLRTAGIMFANHTLPSPKYRWAVMGIDRYASFQETLDTYMEVLLSRKIGALKHLDALEEGPDDMFDGNPEGEPEYRRKRAREILRAYALDFVAEPMSEPLDLSLPNDSYDNQGIALKEGGWISFLES